MPSMTLAKARKKIKAQAKRIKALELLVTSDYLTGLLSRRGMDKALAHHFSLLSRDPCSVNDFAVLYLDLDRFKGINDTYGHQIGDEVLKYFAVTLKDLLRDDYDVISRLSGDEFAVILPESSLEQAQSVKKKIKAALEATPFNVDGIMLSLRTSVGIATVTGAQCGILSPEAILSMADKAMYEDKELGRASREPE